MTQYGVVDTVPRQLPRVVEPGDVLRAEKRVKHNSLNMILERTHFLYEARCRGAGGHLYYLTIDGSARNWISDKHAAEWLGLSLEDFLIWEVMEG